MKQAAEIDIPEADESVLDAIWDQIGRERDVSKSFSAKAAEDKGVPSADTILARALDETGHARRMGGGDAGRGRAARGSDPGHRTWRSVVPG
jgi:hypothetical protein